MAISNAQAAKINKMNRASQNVSLGTIVQNVQSGSATLNGFIRGSGSVLVAVADANASKVEVLTGLTSLVGHIVQAWNSGGSNIAGSSVSAVTDAMLNVQNSGSNLVIRTTASSVTPGHKIYWMVW